MKKILTIICIVWACTAQAQMWFADGTRWNYITFMTGLYAGYAVNGEDTIDNVVYKIMEGFGRVRESNDSVFVRDNLGNDILLYSFSAMPNDTLHFPDISGFSWISDWPGGLSWESSCSKTLVLDSVALVDMYGTQRRMQYWHLDVNPNVLGARTYLHILEGVGCIYFGIGLILDNGYGSAPFNLWEAIMGNCTTETIYTNFICFYDPVHMSVADSCAVLINSSTELPRILEVAPNPAAATAVVQWQQPLTGYLAVTDLTGREVLHQPLQNATAHTLHCHAWPQGVYLLRVVGQDGHRYISKFIIQH